jgi:cytochrome c oxidase cbb3-type subunit III
VNWAAIAAATATLLAAACAPSSPAERFAKDPEALKRGKAIFTGSCGAYCHSATKDKRDAPYLFDCEWLHGGSDEQIHATITNGVPGTRMIGFGDKMPQGDDDIWRVVAYLKSQREPCAGSN